MAKEPKEVKTEPKAAAKTEVEVADKKKYPMQVAKGKALTMHKKMYKEGAEITADMFASDEGKKNLEALIKRGFIEKN